MAELNDEQALSYAESMVNWTRSLRYLEDVCRFVRGARTSIPILQQQVEEATQRKVKAEESAETAEAWAKEQVAGHQQDVAAVREQTQKDIEGIKAEILGQRQVMAQEREQFRQATETLHTEFARGRDALVREEAALRERIVKLQAELEALKQRAATL